MDKKIKSYISENLASERDAQILEVVKSISQSIQHPEALRIWSHSQGRWVPMLELLEQAEEADAAIATHYGRGSDVKEGE